MKRVLAIGLGIGGLGSYWLPGWNGFFFERAMVTAGEGRIAAAVLIVGAAILWFMPTDGKE